MNMNEHSNIDNWLPSFYESTQAYQLDYGNELIESLLRPKKDEVILDLGCGTGRVTRIIADKGARVIGIDSSKKMIDKAKENCPDLEFHVGDGSDFHFQEKFDAVYSSATLHWILEPEKAAACIAGCLRHGGRFVAQFSGRGSVHSISNAANEIVREKGGAPWKSALYLPSIGEYTAILEGCGLDVVFAALLDHLTSLDGGSEGLARWIRTFGHGLLPGISEEERESYIPLLEDRLRDRLWKDGNWHVDYRRLRILAFRNNAYHCSA